MSTSPPSSESSPDRQLSRVVFPQPLGPMIATISPCTRARSTPRSASTRTAPVSYILRTERASTIVARALGTASWTSATGTVMPPAIAPSFLRLTPASCSSRRGASGRRLDAFRRTTERPGESEAEPLEHPGIAAPLRLHLDDELQED